MPPDPASLDLGAELLREMRRSNDALVAQMEKGHATIAAKLDEVNASVKEVQAAVAKVDADLDDLPKEPPGGPVARVLAWVNEQPRLKDAVVTGLAVFIGTAMTALGGYVTFHLTGAAPTPNPVQVAQPIEVVVPAGTMGAAAAEPVAFDPATGGVAP